MISSEAALHIIDTTIKIGPTEEIRMEHANGYVIAEDIIAPISMPPFRQSSMDGYAIKLTATNNYKVCGEIQAGQSSNIRLKEGEAVRIFTGAAVPDTADTVVMQEHVIREGDYINITKRPSPLANVRPIGEQLKKGDLALPKGTVLNPAGLGFLAGLGISKTKVYKKPAVSILLTGDEIQQPGTPLQDGQVYDSNSVTLNAALKSLGISEITIEFIPDTYTATSECIHRHLKSSDVILVSGGISVGDYDFVKEALLENDVEELFYKVNQKPGKPLWFGQKGKTTVFALPGNPASSLSCFYIYVVPALRKMMGYKNSNLEKGKAQLDTEIKNPFGKTLFLKGSVKQGMATPLLGQASSMLQSFATSNALLIVPEKVSLLKEGETISYLDLPS